MIPVRIAGANLTIRPPDDWDVEKHGKCLPMAVRREEADGLILYRTAYEPTPHELSLLMQGGKVVLTSVGTIIPHNLTVSEL